MPSVGSTFYSRIENHPACSVEDCRKRVERRGGSIMSAYCLQHTRDEMHRLVTTGLSWAEARAQIWATRSSERLVFVP